MLSRLSRLYDSHVHWLGTGYDANGLALSLLQNAEEIRELRPQASDFRGDWLVGFGWDQAKWPGAQFPDKKTLDEAFPQFPVLFSRGDGHCSWVNSMALARLGFPSSHDGILKEQDHFKAYAALPALRPEQIRKALLSAAHTFLGQGFTHIRDMTCDEAQWTQAQALDLNQELKLYVVVNFLCTNPHDLQATLNLATRARAEETPHLQVQGLKIFYDGTLGSKTAYLSQPQCGCAQAGASPWQEDSFKDLLTCTWQRGLELSVHTIGDRAADEIVQWTRQVMAENKVTGRLNLEHVEVLRPETIQKMKALHVRCHMQPCHWLSDREWLKDRLGPLLKHAFPWAALLRAGVPLSFGSDSPVAKSSYADNLRALEESAQAGIPALEVPPDKLHVFPGDWGGDHTYTVMKFNQVREVFVDGIKVV